MATFTIDEVILIRTALNWHNDDLILGQIKDGGSDNLKYFKMTKLEQLKAIDRGLIYDANVSQATTGAPYEDDFDGSGTGAALKDTLGGVWSYHGVGEYDYTKVGAFADPTKIKVEIPTNYTNQPINITISCARISDDVLRFTVNSVSSYTAIPILTKTDNVMYVQPIKIFVKY